MNVVALTAGVSAAVALLVSTTIVGILGAKIRYNKLRSKKIEWGEDAAKTNQSTEAVELTTAVVGEVSRQSIKADQTGTDDT